MLRMIDFLILCCVISKDFPKEEIQFTLKSNSCCNLFIAEKLCVPTYINENMAFKILQLEVVNVPIAFFIQ